MEWDVDLDLLFLCPFERGTCDPIGRRVIVLPPEQSRWQLFEAYVECQDCGARGPTPAGHTEAEARDLAIAAWNNRAPTPPPIPR